MSDKVKAGLELVEGKVYLRDKRNGRVHQYEELLGNMSYMERFVEGEEPKNAGPVNTPRFNSSAQDRAAEWDRQASLTPEQREAEAQREQEKKAPPPPPKKQYKLTDKANGKTVPQLMAEGMDKDSMIADGYLVEVT